MIHPVSSTTHIQATQPVSSASSASTATSQSRNASGLNVNDTVQISSAAQAALQEALETPAQTAKEAAHGDHQAMRLLAKEEAAAKG